ncbi:Flagellar biosynthesis protein FliS [Dissulfuribacter thermophilus]|uniref:Flagellar secretion chaperone FliS n=1 Tax=Dissulfuribacter thermophilus TaxID=1156395 RepID=A0A1B9F2L1_9BACT|nr:flagellar export chaperone FliS [Dissulfuribacter thermophilus]OCC14162.1 Flagellar biosynthesis protein FliS [Dissulfuribacter thermophilus]
MYNKAILNYKRTQIVTNHSPEQLILLLYEGAVQALKKAREGVEEQDVRKRGEGLGKAISIIGELNASLDMEAGGETAAFLRGLYLSILTELPKVNLTNDLRTLDIAIGYIEELKKLWKERVMNKEDSSSEIVPVSEQSHKKRNSVSISI